MGSYTAQILVGHGHPNHGGINPTHQAFLNENDRPAWILSRVKDAHIVATWVPTVRHMLDDAMVMLAACVFKDHGVLSHLPSRVHSIELPLLSIQDRRILYGVCRERPWTGKLTLSVLTGSTILGQIKCLRDYNIACEVCISHTAR